MPALLCLTELSQAVLGCAWLSHLKSYLVTKMNLHGIVAGAIGTVNPHVPITLRVSLGYSTGADGLQSPSYQTFTNLIAQVQELTTRDLRQLEGLNVQNSERKIYMSGSASAIVRVNRKGGDLITLPDGTVWLITAVLEQWPDWCAVSATLQVNP